MEMSLEKVKCQKKQKFLIIFKYNLKKSKLCLKTSVLDERIFLFRKTKVE